jgi:hypothetical protein
MIARSDLPARAAMVASPAHGEWPEAGGHLRARAGAPLHRGSAPRTLDSVRWSGLAEKQRHWLLKEPETY